MTEYARRYTQYATPITNHPVLKEIVFLNGEVGRHNFAEPTVHGVVCILYNGLSVGFAHPFFQSVERIILHHSTVIIRDVAVVVKLMLSCVLGAGDVINFVEVGVLLLMDTLL